jgi:hypothetical protein
MALVLLHHGRRREALPWALRAAALLRSEPEPRVFKYALEAILPPAVYGGVRSVGRRLGLARPADIT